MMLAFKYRWSLFFALLLSIQTNAQTNYSALVNPFIGTGGHGHTYPGASMPFGMMQLSPDTRLEGWDGCSGYHYSDNKIYGFSHTHLSGTGIADYCDVLLMPFTGDVQWKNSDYASPFSHDNEKASPGFYEVL
ncbi:MAG: glycoside hydrolase family 92 protein, partial [Ferruginibacter sp.]